MGPVLFVSGLVHGLLGFGGVAFAILAPNPNSPSVSKAMWGTMWSVLAVAAIFLLPSVGLACLVDIAAFGVWINIFRGVR